MRNFELYVPPGWLLIDLADDLEGSLSHLASQVVRSAPVTQQPDTRRAVTESLLPGIRALAARGVSAILLPTGSVSASPQRPLVTIAPMAGAPGVDPIEVLRAVVQGDETATVVDAEPLVAVRTHSEVRVAEEALAAAQAVLDDLVPADDPRRVVPAGLVEPTAPAVLSTRVRYLMGLPDDAQAWVDVQLAVDRPDSADGEELATETLALFDAVIQTFRWTP